MLIERTLTGVLNTLTENDTVVVKDNIPTGSAEKEVTLNELKLLLDKTGGSVIKTKVLEGSFDLTDLDDTEVIIVADLGSPYCIRGLQFYVEEEILIEEESTITQLGLSLNDELALSLALDAATTIDFVAALPVLSGEIKLVALDGDGETPTGTIVGGKIKVRVVIETVDSIATNYQLI